MTENPTVKTEVLKIQSEDVFHKVLELLMLDTSQNYQSLTLWLEKGYPVEVETKIIASKKQKGINWDLCYTKITPEEIKKAFDKYKDSLLSRQGKSFTNDKLKHLVEKRNEAPYSIDYRADMYDNKTKERILKGRKNVLGIEYSFSDELRTNLQDKIPNRDEKQTCSNLVEKPTKEEKSEKDRQFEFFFKKEEVKESVKPWEDDCPF